jgi:hypothetical protein
MNDLLNGMRIIEDWAMVDAVEDWSRVRSPARARRRMRYGHKQNVVIRHVPKKAAYQVDGNLIMHPEMARALRQEIGAGS